MARRKSGAEAEAHYKESARYIPERYRAGVRVADWEGPATTDLAEKHWWDGLADAKDKDLRRAGIRAKGNAAWRKDAEEKGGAVIGRRVEAAAPVYGREFGPMLDEVNKFAETLPPWEREAPDANIDRRLRAVVKKWRELAGKV